MKLQIKVIVDLDISKASLEVIKRFLTSKDLHGNRWGGGRRAFYHQVLYSEGHAILESAPLDVEFSMSQSDMCAFMGHMNELLGMVGVLKVNTEFSK